MLAIAGTAAPSMADVWQYRENAESSFHRSLDHLQRQRLSEHWRPPSAAELIARRVKFDPMIRALARRHGLDPDLVHAIVLVESAYDPIAVSKAGAIGLMQLMPATAERFGVIDATDPEQNIEAGVRYLKTLAVQFDRLELVLAAYNAGEDAVERFGRTVPPYPETQAYVDRLLTLLDRRDGLFD